MKGKRVYLIGTLTILVGILIGVLMSGFVAIAEEPPSDVPMTMNYQGVLHGPQGRLTGGYAMTFAIWDAASDGDKIWQETQQVTVTSGTFWS